MGPLQVLEREPALKQHRLQGCMDNRACVAQRANCSPVRKGRRKLENQSLRKSVTRKTSTIYHRDLAPHVGLGHGEATWQFEESCPD